MAAANGAQLIENAFSHALNSLLKGQPDPYTRMITRMEAFLSQGDSGARMAWIKAVQSVLPLITEKCRALVECLLSFPHQTATADVLRTFEHVVLHLALSHSQYTRVVVVAMLRAMTEIDCAIVEDEGSLQPTWVLQSIVRDQPEHTDAVFQIMYEHFPQPWDDTEVHQRYVHGCFRLARSCPGLKERIVALVVDHIIVLDVDLSQINIEDVSDDGEQEADLQFDVELDGGLGQGSEDAVRHKTITDRLDYSIDALFRFLNKECGIGDGEPAVGDSGASMFERREEVFRLLLRIFDRGVLATHGTRYAQFILFYVTRMEPQFPVQFLGFLVRTSVDVGTPPIVRQRALAYAGSYLARAKFVDAETLCTVLQAVLEWTLTYIRDLPARPVAFSADDVRSEEIDPTHHLVFYSACQMLMYVVCFRADSVMDMEDRTFLARIGFEVLIQSKLNPLQYCLSSVVSEFCSLVQRTQQELSVDVVRARNAEVRHRELDSEQTCCVFPFDPIYLKRSSGFLEGLYVEWKGEDEEDGDGEADSGDERSKTTEDEASASGSVDSVKRSPFLSFAVPAMPSESPLEDLMSITPDFTTMDGNFDLNYYFNQ